MNGTRTTFDRHGGQKQTLRMRARCFMGYGIKIVSPALRNDVTRSPGTLTEPSKFSERSLFFACDTIHRRTTF